MKERMKRLFACVGTVGVMTVTMAVPAMAGHNRGESEYRYSRGSGSSAGRS